MKSTNIQGGVSQRLNFRAGFADYVKTSAVAIAAAAPVTAMANFSGDYTVNPPPNGVYTDAAATGSFGNWTGTWTGFDNPFTDVTLNTTAAPAGISILTDGAPLYTFLVTAAASGLVSFDYVSSRLFDLFAIDDFASDIEFINQTTAMAFSLNTGTMFSTNVAAGDIFGFRLTAAYEGTNSISITNFSAPEPAAPNGVPDQGSTLALLTFGFIGLLAYRAKSGRRSTVGA